jgi:hypothetical protein
VVTPIHHTHGVSWRERTTDLPRAHHVVSTTTANIKGPMTPMLKAMSRPLLWASVTRRPKMLEISGLAGPSQNTNAPYPPNHRSPM